ncbi:hypothetical protein D3C80_884470 [compost metagenome]
MPAATAAAAPPDEPAGDSLSSKGCRATGPSRGSLASAMPNSGTVVVPKKFSPALRSRAASSESSSSGASAQAREPRRIGRPAQGPPRSLNSDGTPAKGAFSGLVSTAVTLLRPSSASRYAMAPRGRHFSAASTAASIASRVVKTPFAIASASAVASCCFISSATSAAVNVYYLGSAGFGSILKVPALISARRASILASTSAGAAPLT